MLLFTVFAPRQRPAGVGAVRLHVCHYHTTGHSLTHQPGASSQVLVYHRLTFLIVQTGCRIYDVCHIPIAAGGKEASLLCRVHTGSAAARRSAACIIVFSLQHAARPKNQWDVVRGSRG